LGAALIDKARTEIPGIAVEEVDVAVNPTVVVRAPRRHV
jgi:hypothetical protein